MGQPFMFSIGLFLLKPFGEMVLSIEIINGQSNPIG